MRDVELWDELNDVLVLMMVCLCDDADNSDRTRLMEHMKKLSSLIDKGKRQEEERYQQWRKAHRIDELLAQKDQATE